MSVPKGRRKLSKLEVVYQASKVHDVLYTLVLRSFGINSKNSPLRRKYQMSVHLESSSDRIDQLIEESKNHLISIADEINTLINKANSIYPRNKLECELRLSYQNKALAACTQALVELTDIARMFDADINCFKESVQAIEYEKHLIIEWRKFDRNRFKGYSL